MNLTRHAIKRFQERVEQLPAKEVARIIMRAAARASVRPKPRWWTPVAPSAGLLFLYPATLPGICLLVRERSVVTVLTRAQCRVWRARRDAEIVKHDKRAYHRPSPGASFLDAA